LVAIWKNKRELWKKKRDEKDVFLKDMSFGSRAQGMA
jgi:hypothetical protein